MSVRRAGRSQPLSRVSHARLVAAESGQALVITVGSLFVLLAMAGLVIDVGFWYQTKRHDQAVADAAALAGAQALPDDPAQATALAVNYANKNGFNLPSSDVSVTSGATANDTINISFTHAAPTFFVRVLGINSVTIGSTASAQAEIPGAARWVAPIAVNRFHPMLKCSPPPCTGATEVDLADLKQPGSPDAAGNFSLLDLTGSSNGNVGNSTLASWMENGYDQAMPLGIYTGAPGADFNSGTFDQALSDRIGTEVLFPVYDPPVVLSGSNARFDVIGWVGFQISSYTAHGNSGAVYGTFTRYIAQGVAAANPNTQPDLGVRTIQLTR